MHPMWDMAPLSRDPRCKESPAQRVQNGVYIGLGMRLSVNAMVPLSKCSNR